MEAACAAVEAEEGFEDWRSLGGQEPLRFLSDLARVRGHAFLRARAYLRAHVLGHVHVLLRVVEPP